MKLAPHLYRIETATAKAVYIYLLRGKVRTLMLDSGLANTPEEVIMPYFARHGLAPDELTDCLITHADCDHCGGNHTLLEHCPSCQLYASEKDRALIEDPIRLRRERYEAYEDEHHVGYNDATKTWLVDVGGQATPIRQTLRGNEVFDLGMALACKCCRSRVTPAGT